METEVKQVERQLKTTDQEQRQLLQWALKGFPEDQVEAENKRINKMRETLAAQKADLETHLKASQDAILSIPKLERTMELLQCKLENPDFAAKRDFIESLGIKIWLDGENVEITGFIPTEDPCVVHTSSE